MDNIKIRKELINIGLPLSLNSLMYSAMSYIDMLMISSLGSIELSALGLASKVIWVNISIMTAIVGALSIFLPRYIGTNERIEQMSVIRVSRDILALCALFLSLIQFSFSLPISSIISPNSEVAYICAQYLETTSLINIFIAISMICDTIFRCHKQTKYLMYLTIVEVSVGILLNYILIFGKLGLPPMDVEGAALGTVIAKSIRSLGGIAKCLSSYGLSYLLFGKFSPENLAKLLKQSVPMLLTSVSWSIGLAVGLSLIANIGVEFFGVHILISGVEALFVAIAWGLCCAAGVEFAQRYETSTFEELLNLQKLLKAEILKLMLLSCLAYSIVIMMMYRMVDTLYIIDLSIIIVVMIISVLLFLAKGLVMFNISSILQNCGDSTNNFYIGFISQWLLSLPLIYLFTKISPSTYYILILVLLTEEAFKILISERRITSLLKNKKLIKAL